MPRLHEILKPEEAALLHHPIIGFVRWTPEWGVGPSHYLDWATGREKGRGLQADTSVIFDDDWRIATETELANFENGVDNE